jgi:hypothetical protein
MRTLHAFPGFRGDGSVLIADQNRSMRPDRTELPHCSARPDKQNPESRFRYVLIGDVGLKARRQFLQRLTPIPR